MPNDKTRSKPCTVAFFEVVHAKGQDQFTGINWQPELKRLGTSPTSHTIDGKQVRGEVYETDAKMRYLSLDTARTTMPRQRDTKTFKRAEMSTNGVDWEPIEEAFVAFFEHNIVGIAKTSNSAPSHVVLAQWLNRALNPSEKYYLRPIVSTDRYQRLEAMRGVSLASITLHPQAAGAAQSSLIKSMLRVSRVVGSDLRIEVRIVPGRKKGKPENEKLLEEVHELLRDIQLDGDHSGVEKAVVNGIPENGGPVEPIGLIEQSLTSKRDVLLTVKNGAISLDEVSAVQAIQRAEEGLRDDLRAALGIPLPDGT